MSKERKSKFEWLQATAFGEAVSALWLRVRTVFLRRRLQSGLEDEIEPGEFEARLVKPFRVDELLPLLKPFLPV